MTFSNFKPFFNQNLEGRKHIPTFSIKEHFVADVVLKASEVSTLEDERQKTNEEGRTELCDDCEFGAIHRYVLSAITSSYASYGSL